MKAAEVAEHEVCPSCRGRGWKYSGPRRWVASQHEARGADQAITCAIDTHVQAKQASDDDGSAGVLAPVG